MVDYQSKRNHVLEKWDIIAKSSRTQNLENWQKDLQDDIHRHFEWANSNQKVRRRKIVKDGKDTEEFYHDEAYIRTFCKFTIECHVGFKNKTDNQQMLSIFESLDDDTLNMFGNAIPCMYYCSVTTKPNWILDYKFTNVKKLKPHEKSKFVQKMVEVVVKIRDAGAHGHYFYTMDDDLSKIATRLSNMHIDKSLVTDKIAKDPNLIRNMRDTYKLLYTDRKIVIPRVNMEIERYGGPFLIYWFNKAADQLYMFNLNSLDFIWWSNEFFQSILHRHDKNWEKLNVF